MTSTYLDATAKQALDALVAQLDRTVAASAGAAVQAPLEDLRDRLAGLGDREGAVLERLGEVLAAAQAGPARTEEAEQGLRSALDAAAARTVEDLTRAVEAGLERILAPQTMATWQAHLAEAIQAFRAETTARLDALQAAQEQGLEAINSAHGRTAGELEGLATRMQALQAETQRVLEACEAERKELPARLEAAVDEVATRVRQSIVPAAMAVDERLGRAEAAQEALRATVEQLPGKIAAELGVKPDPQQFSEALAPMLAGQERAHADTKARWEALEVGLQATQGKMAGCADDIQGIARAVELLGNRLSFTQEEFTGQGYELKKLGGYARGAIGLALVNLLVVMAVAGAFAARFLHM